MEISPILQARLALYGAFFGVALSILYDISAVLCTMLEGQKWLFRTARFALDLALCTLCGFGIVLLCYYFNYGEIRGFCVLGVAGGFFLWKATLSRLTRRLVFALLRLFLKAIRFFVTPFIKIFKFLVNILKKTIQYVGKTLAKIFKLVYNRVYNILQMVSVLKKARNGFL